VALPIDTVFVWVTDLDRSVDWYRRLGIDAGPRHGSWQAMAVDGEARLGLHQGERPARGSTAGIAFRVEDLDAEMARLAAEGVHPTEREVTDTGSGRFITYLDPDGNEIQLIER
jgi:catechol 2,3-dioxygenase-like lactoylglutathione lyase family enzyme